MQYYIDTESILASVNTFAQAYGESSYGAEVYSGEETTTPTTPVTPQPGIPGIPNTGIFMEQPILFVPVILVGAILIAGAILIIKRTIRRIRG